MSKRIFGVLLFAALVLLVAPSAFADLQPFQNDAPAYDIVDNCDSVDACFASGGTYGDAGMTTCSSYRHCYTCASDASNTVTHVMCAEVSMSASCSCSLTQSGTSWSCSRKGTCRYKS